MRFSNRPSAALASRSPPTRAIRICWPTSAPPPRSCCSKPWPTPPSRWWTREWWLRRPARWAPSVCVTTPSSPPICCAHWSSVSISWCTAAPNTWAATATSSPVWWPDPTRWWNPSAPWHSNISAPPSAHRRPTCCNGESRPCRCAWMPTCTMRKESPNFWPLTRQWRKWSTRGWPAIRATLPLAPSPAALVAWWA